MVIALPLRSTARPAATRIQPSLTQYSSTLVFSLPLKRMPTPRSSSPALKYGLLGSEDRRSGSSSLIRGHQAARLAGLQPEITRPHGERHLANGHAVPRVSAAGNSGIV